MGRKPIPEKDRKKSSDYPQFAFRLSKKDKDRLLKEINAVQERLNSDRDEEKDPHVNKNDIILKALFEGLKRV